MAILFVVSSGFTLFSHVCLMGGEKEISSRQIESCCSSEAPATESRLSADCCDDEVQFIKFDFISVTVQYQLNHQFVATDFVIDHFVSDSEEINTSLLFYHNLPPPKTGREILSYNRAFRI